MNRASLVDDTFRKFMAKLQQKLQRYSSLPDQRLQLSIPGAYMSKYCVDGINLLSIVKERIIINDVGSCCCVLMSVRER